MLSFGSLLEAFLALSSVYILAWFVRYFVIMAAVPVDTPPFRSGGPLPYPASASDSPENIDSDDRPIFPADSPRTFALARPELCSSLDELVDRPDLRKVDSETWDTLDRIAALSYTPVPILAEFRSHEADGPLASNGPHTKEIAPQPKEKPFHRWMKSLRRRSRRRQALYRHYMDQELSAGAHLTGADDSDSYQRRFGHCKSLSGSSSGFITAVKSASISLASISIVTRSRGNTAWSSRPDHRTDRSSHASGAVGRFSEESCFDWAPAVDRAVTERSLQRRRILEELISTEESYISDLRFLMNVGSSHSHKVPLHGPSRGYSGVLNPTQVYVTTLASLPTIAVGLRSSTNRNLAEIVELHEEILGDLHRAVPNSEYTQLDAPLPESMTPACQRADSHRRWRSLDVVAEDRIGLSWLQSIPGMTCEPQVAAEVAKLFGKRVSGPA